MPHQQAGYTDAILSLSPPSQYLAKREETIYGLGATHRNPTTGLYAVGLRDPVANPTYRLGYHSISVGAAEHRRENRDKRDHV